MQYSDLITVDSDILHGTPVFINTRVPVQSLFWNLEKGISLDEFLDDFPTVSREQAVQLLELSGKLFSIPDLKNIYEAAVGTSSWNKSR